MTPPQPAQCATWLARPAAGAAMQDGALLAHCIGVAHVRAEDRQQARARAARLDLPLATAATDNRPKRADRPHIAGIDGPHRIQVGAGAADFLDPARSVEAADVACTHQPSRRCLRCCPRCCGASEPEPFVATTRCRSSAARFQMAPPPTDPSPSCPTATTAARLSPTERSATTSLASGTSPNGSY
jgi:hypothetical protein